jgi:hypothetical protein
MAVGKFGQQVSPINVAAVVRCLLNLQVEAS